MTEAQPSGERPMHRTTPFLMRHAIPAASTALARVTSRRRPAGAAEYTYKFRRMLRRLTHLLSKGQPK
jgi:hypothetical protein